MNDPWKGIIFKEMRDQNWYISVDTTHSLERVYAELRLKPMALRYDISRLMIEYELKILCGDKCMKSKRKQEVGEYFGCIGRWDHEPFLKASNFEILLKVKITEILVGDASGATYHIGNASEYGFV